MSIRIVADSACDLPAETIARYGITVVPLYINIGNKRYLDGVEITREEFYRNSTSDHPVPTTAVTKPEEYRAVYETLTAQGADQVLAIHISIALSAVVDSARLAAQGMRVACVTVFDSRQLSLGTGFMVETAAQMAQAGSSMGEIIARLQQQTKRTHVFAALDTLDDIKRSGRMPDAVAAIDGLLQLKPLVTMYDGKPRAERVRTRERATQRLLEMLYDLGELERVAIVHTHAPQRAAELRAQAAHLLPPDNILTVDVTPVIGAHIGPNAVGFACVARK